MRYRDIPKYIRTKERPGGTLPPFQDRASRLLTCSLSIVGLIFLIVGRHTSKSVSQVVVATTHAEVPVASPAPSPTALDPNFEVQIEKCFLPVSTVYGFNLYITAGFRSPADQDALYAQGRTENGHIVTNAQGGQSIHNYGFAVDVADHQYGQDIAWETLEKIGNYCGLEHGDRGFVDLPHFQYIGGLNREDLQAGKRPKPLTLPCPIMTTTKNLTQADLNSCGAPVFATTTSVYEKMKPLNNYYNDN